MSFCGGKVCCEIYRDKKYCRRGDHAENGEPCDCRHAKWACEVDACSIADKCRHVPASAWPCRPEPPEREVEA